MENYIGAAPSKHCALLLCKKHFYYVTASMGSRQLFFRFLDKSFESVTTDVVFLTLMQ